jgi:hypothetical protein
VLVEDVNGTKADEDDTASAAAGAALAAALSEAEHGGRLYNGLLQVGG